MAWQHQLLNKFLKLLVSKKTDWVLSLKCIKSNKGTEETNASVHT